MFGLTFEKLLVIAVLAALIVGPQNLPGYVYRLGEFIRTLRAYADAARASVEAEAGTSLRREDWRTLDPRHYDLRRVIRDAINEPPEFDGAAADTPATGQTTPSPTYAITGSSGHPRWVRVDPDHDVTASSQPGEADAESTNPVNTPVDA